jgi:tetratricopeptide (TPR) repeat protein
MKKIKVKKTQKFKNEEQAALSYVSEGNLLQAEIVYKNILRTDPNNFNSLHMLGVIYYQLSQYDLAMEYFKEALQYNPTHADAYFNLGNAYSEKKQFDEAVACYRKAIQYNPDILEAYDNLGHAYMAINQYDKAIASYQEVVHRKPDSIMAYHNLGNALHQNARYDEAILWYQKAIDQNSSNADTHNNLGALLQRKGQIDAAIRCYQEAIKHNSNYAIAYQNLGNALQEKGQFDEAIKYYQKSLQLNANFVDAHINMSLIYLLSGNFDLGWKEYEWRTKLKDFPRRHFSQPMWDGSDITGKTILCHAEQGYGDTIQFIRYAPLIARRGARVIVECLQDLASLLKSVKGLHQVIVRGETLPAFDLHCPLLSLPLVFNTTLESIPANIPYLTSDPLFVEKWRDKLHADRSEYKTGLVWSGNPQHINEQKRSFSLSMFMPLSRVNDITFYSLQKGEAAKQAKNPPQGMKLIDYTEDMHDFSDTAAFVENLDLVISVDTAAAHLAGALGKPVWILLPFVPDWRWLLKRDDSPWYPTMRLFRQPALGDWESVIAKVAAELQKIMARRIT